MIIQLERRILAETQQHIEEVVQGLGYQSNEVRTQKGHYLVCIGKRELDIRQLGALAGVKDIHRVSDAYKLVSKKWKVGTSSIDLGDGVMIGDGHCALMAGPCSIEGPEQVDSTLEQLKGLGIKIMRGGVYKPRSSPYSFRGLGMDGLKMWYEKCQAAGIKIITEVMQVSQIEDMYPYVDVFQVGARNAQNFNLLDALGEVDKAVLLKRGISGSIDELLHSAEYIFSAGNEAIMLCERGIRTYENAYRNTLDLNAVPILKEKTHLPVIVDPSHGIGVRKHVEAMSLASVAAGADGLIIEMHECPEKAFSDGQQSLNYLEFSTMIEKIKRLEEAL